MKEGDHQVITQRNWDVIVVGSGFGGSVSALRLAEKGYRVLVLEKGRRYLTKDFPKTNWNFRKFFWMPRLFMYGIQCMTLLRNVFVLHGAGVGGGSLVYAGTLLVPPDEFFENKNWPGTGWKDKLTPYYEKAKKMLGAVKVQYEAETDKLLKACAAELGRESTYDKVNVGVYFGNPGETRDDPYFNGLGPERTGCTLCSGCMVGCRVNAKNTLDKNYLYLAEGLGVEILPEHEVEDIRLLSNGNYQIRIRKSTGFFKASYNLQAGKIIMSGGVMGTVKLLLGCRKKGSLKDISAKLGDFVRTNSEAIIGIKLRKKPAASFSKGVAISAGFHPDENTHVQTVRYGKNQTAMALLTTFLPERKSPLPGIVAWLISVVRSPLEFAANFLPFRWAEKTIILLVMQPVNNYLRLTYERRWWRLGGLSMNSHPHTGKPIPSHIPSGAETAKKIRKKTGGTILTTYMDAFFRIPTTAHILGGACMGKDIYSGVIDENFQVFNYPGLYVIDGSVIPSNLGVNPSLTITALAEYAMSRFPGKNE